MTQISIQNQIEAIKKARTKATRSKEAALKFLTEAGIIKEENRTSKVKTKK